jgi:hypothetical protein
MSTVYRVTALVDWDTARRITPLSPGPRRFDTLFDRLQTGMANYISSIDNKNIYRVNWRFYHGWYQGKTKTADRLTFEKYLFTVRSRTIRHVSFGTDFSFSETLSCGSKRNPIFDTLRRDLDTGRLHQKMVDTSLVCDLLHLVRCQDSNLYIVIASDDDILPALFTAETWRGRVVLMHDRAHTNAHLPLDGLTTRMNFT